ASAIIGGTVNGPLPGSQINYVGSLQTGAGHVCGAVLVKPQAVITAAHCVANVDPREIRIRVGTLDRTMGGTLDAVSLVVNHPTYDLALVRLTAKVSQHPVSIRDTDMPVGS